MKESVGKDNAYMCHVCICVPCVIAMSEKMKCPTCTNDLKQVKLKPKWVKLLQSLPKGSIFSQSAVQYYCKTCRQYWLVDSVAHKIVPLRKMKRTLSPKAMAIYLTLDLFDREVARTLMMLDSEATLTLVALLETQEIQGSYQELVKHCMETTHVSENEAKHFIGPKWIRDCMKWAQEITKEAETKSEAAQR